MLQRPVRPLHCPRLRKLTAEGAIQSCEAPSPGSNVAICVSSRAAPSVFGDRRALGRRLATCPRTHCLGERARTYAARRAYTETLHAGRFGVKDVRCGYEAVAELALLVRDGNSGLPRWAPP
jgi:hypothetical protein